MGEPVWLSGQPEFRFPKLTWIWVGGEPFESSSTRNSSQNIARGTTDPEIDSCAVQRWNSNMALCCQVSQTLDKNVVFVSVRFGGREKGRGDCKLDENYCRHTDGWTPLQTGSVQIHVISHPNRPAKISSPRLQILWDLIQTCHVWTEEEDDSLYEKSYCYVFFYWWLPFNLSGLSSRWKYVWNTISW